MSGRRSFGARDQAISGFAAPLGRLCDALPAIAAAIVDPDGETVDYAGRLQPFEIKVMAAELALLMSGLRRCKRMSGTEVIIRARDASFAIVRLGDGYSLAVRLPYGAFHMSRRAMSEAVRELCVEGGFELPVQFAAEQWLRVDVQEDGSEGRRPLALWLAQRWSAVEVLGRYHGAELKSREVAYRIRLGSGQEATVVRERLGKWFSDRVL